MKAAVLVEGPKIVLQDRPIPKPEPNEVVVKVYRAAICGTDFHAIEGTYTCKYPVVLGHEFSGEVREVGSAVKVFSRGDRVVVEGMIGCGFCEMCRRGIPHYCKQNTEIGFSHDGGWQEYVAVPSQNLYCIPDSMSYDEGALVEPLVCALGAIGKVKIVPGDNVLIIGSGPGGLFMVQLARLYGAGRIILAGRRKERLELAKKFGANKIIDGLKESLRERVNKLTDNQGVDVSVDAVGIQSTVRDAIELAAPEGQVVLYGVGEGRDKRIDTDLIVLKMLTVVGDQSSHRWWNHAIKLIADGQIDVNSMITHHFPLDDIHTALSYAQERKEGAIKVLLDISL